MLVCSIAHLVQYWWKSEHEIDIECENVEHWNLKCFVFIIEIIDIYYFYSMVFNQQKLME